MAQGFYELLGVDEGAPVDELRAAYQRRLAALVRRLRDARLQGADVSILEAQERELREAMDVLSDPVRRRRYDAYRRTTRDGLPTEAEELWERVRAAMVDPAAVLALQVVRSLTHLPLGDPLPVPPELRVHRVPAPPPPPPPPPPPVEAEPPAPSPAAPPAAPPIPVLIPSRPSWEFEPEPVRAEPPPRVAQVRVEPPPEERRGAVASLWARLGVFRGDDSADSPDGDRDTSRPTAVPATDPGSVARRADPPFELPRHAPALPPAHLLLDLDAELEAALADEPRRDDPRPAPRAPPAPEPDAGLDDVARLARAHGLTGRFLREVREHRKLTVEDVSRSTRISGRYLAAIEADDYERLPSATFVRGYIKQLAEVLEVSDRGVVEGFMDRFRQQRG